MQYVVGIDPSLTSTGVTVLDENGNRVVHDGQRGIAISTPCGQKVHDRIHRIATLTADILRHIPGNSHGDYNCVSAICIEGYSMGSKSSSLTQICEFGGLLRFRLCSRYENVYEVAPSTLKSWATGKGAFKGGGKVPLVVAITKRYDVQFATDDEYDSYGLARIALQIAKFEQPAVEHQRAAIDVVINGRPKKPKPVKKS